MQITDTHQIYNILQNLSNLEISYLEYRQPKDFVKYQTYLDYFNNYIIKSHRLSRFYFPQVYPELSSWVLNFDDLKDQITINPGYDFAVCKAFNFPNAFRHKCNYFTGIYLLKGSGHLKLDQLEFQVNVGDFVLIPPNVYYALETTPESIGIYFDIRRGFMGAEYKNIFHDNPILTSFIKSSLASDSAMTHLVLHTTGKEQITELILAIFSEYVNGDKYSNNAMKCYLLLLFAAILRDEDTKIESSVEVSRADYQYQQILDYLKQNYQMATLSSTADHIHFSKQYVCRIIKQKTGNTFNDLLTEIRLHIVEEYILDTELSLENIAELSGFSSASHLSKVFKKHYGTTPSAYRKNNMIPEKPGDRH